MVHVERDEKGEIVALHKFAKQDVTEITSITDDEVLKFLEGSTDTDDFSKFLSASDIGVIRIIEDLVDLLIEKNIILFTELPIEAQEKLKSRKNVRAKMGEQSIMIDENELL